MVQHRQASEQLFAGNSQIARLMRSQDWSRTPLGSVEAWSQSLKTAINILLNTGYPMLLVWGRDRILFYNDACRMAWGDAPPVLPGHPIAGICPEIEQVFVTGRSLPCERLSGLGWGDRKPQAVRYTWCYNPLWDEAGQVGGVFATGTESQVRETTLASSEEQLRLVNYTLAELHEREKNFRAMFDLTSVGMVQADAQTRRFLRVNAALCKITGYSEAELLTMKIDDIHHPDDRDCDRERFERWLQGSWLQGTTSGYQSEKRYLRKDGSTIWVQETANLIHTSNGQSPRTIAIIQDITERKQAEERFRLVTQAVNGLIFDWNLQTNEVYRSDKLYDLVGVHPEAAPPDASWWHERIHPEDMARLQPQIAELFASSQHSYDGEYRVWHEAGYWVNVWEQAYLVRSEPGQIHRIVGCTVDISDRKRVEAEREQLLQDLAIERAQFEAVLRQMPAGVIIAEAPSGHLILGNQQAEQIWRQPFVRANTIGEYQEYRGFHVDGKPYQPEEWPLARSLLTGEVVTQEEIHFLRGDGTKGVMETSSTPIYNQQGQITSGVVIFQDISERARLTAERKQIEEALRTSEERLRFAVEGATLGSWEYDLVSSQIVWSEQAKRMFGVPLDAEVDYELFIHTLHPDDRDRIHAAIEQAIEQQSLYDVELRSIWEDGSIHWIRSIGRARYDSNGVATRMFGVSLDITKRKQSEEDLRESERRFRRLVESNMFGVAFGDFAGNIHYVNDYFLNMVGYTREEIEAGNIQWTEITPAEFLSLDQQAAVELRNHGVSTPFEKEYIRKDGTRVPILIGSALLQEPYDQQQEIIAFYLDLTAQKQSEAERERLLQQAQAAQAEAETANRIKDEFLAVLSHELRSPLNPILGWSKLLQTNPFDHASMLRGLQTIERNAKLQTQLIEDLLDVSRILRGKMALTVCPVNLVTVIESALETVRLAAEAKQIQIHTVLIANEVQTLGDAARLQQIVWNLLSNAVKFTPTGGQIKVCLEQIGTYAQIQVKDTGKGISPNFLPHVFDCFRQEDGKTTRKFGGLGLGLAIVRHLTELHGGTVSAESLGEGQGSTFIIQLPLMPQSTLSSQLPKTSTDISDFSQLNILVVDDDADMRDLMQIILEQQNAQVRVATSASEALHLFNQQLPDLLISDIGMPDMDGYQLMQQIRRRSPEQGGYVLAIALTAYAGEYDREQALAAGFQQHIPKPIEPDTLVQAIATLIHQGR